MNPVVLELYQISSIVMAKDVPYQSISTYRQSRMNALFGWKFYAALMWWVHSVRHFVYVLMEK